MDATSWLMVGRGDSTGDRQRDKCSKVTTNHGIIIPRRQQKRWVVWFVGTPQDLISLAHWLQAKCRAVRCSAGLRLQDCR